MLIPLERVVGDSSKDHTVTTLTPLATSQTTVRYTTMRDSIRSLLVSKRGSYGPSRNGGCSFSSEVRRSRIAALVLSRCRW